MRSLLLLIFGLIASAATPGEDWPQFLGPNRNGSDSSPANGVSLGKPALLWKSSIGAGFSSPVVAEGKLILFHRSQNKEIVESLNASTGERLWRFDYSSNYRDDFGFDEGPRGTPAIAAGRVFTFGAEGLLHALDFSTGKKIWSIDTHSKFGVRKAFFGAAASPLVEGQAVYLNVGGPKGAGLAAFDTRNGNVLWTATDDDAGYSSPIAATIGGARTILCLTRAGLVGADPASGKVRFRFPWRSRTNASVNAAVPLVIGDLVFLSASYNTGAVLLRIQGDQPAKLWESDESLSNHYATSVHKDGYLFGFHGRQEMGQVFRCIEMKTGKVRWSADGFGAGTVTLLGDRLLIIRENGEAVLAPAVPDSFKPERKVQLLPGVVRSYPAVAGGRVYVRNEQTLAAWSLK